MRGSEAGEIQQEEYLRDREEYERQIQEVEDFINGWGYPTADTDMTKTEGDDMQDAEDKDTI